MAATGMPLASTRHCDIPFVIKDGVTGFLAPENDPAALSECIEQWLRSAGHWDTMLFAGRAHIEQNHDVVLQAQKLAALYRRILA